MSELIFTDKRDKEASILMSNTLISILQHLIPITILKEISIYAIGSIHQCNGCNRHTHTIFSDKRLTEKAFRQASIINETLRSTSATDIRTWLECNNFHFYSNTYTDHNNQSQLLFFCNNCILNLTLCKLCYKFDVITTTECRRYHRSTKTHYRCCGCQQLFDLQMDWCMSCNGCVCEYCCIECECDEGYYCSFRRSWKCFQFLDLFLHIFYSSRNTNDYFQNDKYKHMNHVTFGNEVKYLKEIWRRIYRKYIKQILVFDKNVITKQTDLLRQNIQSLDKMLEYKCGYKNTKCEDELVMKKLIELIQEINKIDAALENEHRLHNVNFGNTIQSIVDTSAADELLDMSNDYTQNIMLCELAVNYNMSMDAYRKGFLFGELRFRQRKYKNNRKVRCVDRNRKLKSYHKRRNDRKMNHISNKKFVKRYLMSLQY
eukprot:201093_1